AHRERACRRGPAAVLAEHQSPPAAHRERACRRGPAAVFAEHQSPQAGGGVIPRGSAPAAASPGRCHQRHPDAVCFHHPCAAGAGSRRRAAGGRARASPALPARPEGYHSLHRDNVDRRRHRGWRGRRSRGGVPARGAREQRQSGDGRLRRGPGRFWRRRPSGRHRCRGAPPWKRRGVDAGGSGCGAAAHIALTLGHGHHLHAHCHLRLQGMPQARPNL
ncbi:hypothetical protein CYMTET_6737, partial [Cymbomonas tetramitiformis]